MNECKLLLKTKVCFWGFMSLFRLVMCQEWVGCGQIYQGWKQRTRKLNTQRKNPSSFKQTDIAHLKVKVVCWMFCIQTRSGHCWAAYHHHWWVYSGLMCARVEFWYSVQNESKDGVGARNLLRLRKEEGPEAAPTFPLSLGLCKTVL